MKPIDETQTFNQPIHAHALIQGLHEDGVLEGWDAKQQPSSCVDARQLHDPDELKIQHGGLKPIKSTTSGYRWHRILPVLLPGIKTTVNVSSYITHGVLHPWSISAQTEWLLLFLDSPQMCKS